VLFHFLDTGFDASLEVLSNLCGLMAFEGGLKVSQIDTNTINWMVRHVDRAGIG
jgi:hypothetical protein